MSIEQSFQKLINRIQPTDAASKRLETHIAQIRARLAEDLDVAKTSLVGSFWKGTAVHAHSDADLMTVLTRDEIGRWNPNGSSSGILRRVAAALKKRYPLTAIRRDAQAVRVQFAGSGHAVDVVPAQFHEFGTKPSFLIPDGDGDWLVTSPESQREVLYKAQRASGGKLLRTVQILKWWAASRAATDSLSSYYLETLLIHVGAQPGLTYPEAVAQALDVLHANKVPDLRDPTGLNQGGVRPCRTSAQRTMIKVVIADARSRAHKALEAAHTTSLASYYWNLVFNKTFQ